VAKITHQRSAASLAVFKSTLDNSLKTSFSFQGDYLSWSRNNPVKHCGLCHWWDQTAWGYLSPSALYLRLYGYVHSSLCSERPASCIYTARHRNDATLDLISSTAVLFWWWAQAN